MCTTQCQTYTHWVWCVMQQDAGNMPFQQLVLTTAFTIPVTSSLWIAWSAGLKDTMITQIITLGVNYSIGTICKHANEKVYAFPIKEVQTQLLIM